MNRYGNEKVNDASVRMLQPVKNVIDVITEGFVRVRNSINDRSEDFHFGVDGSELTVNSSL